MPAVVSPELAARIEQSLASARDFEKFAVGEGRVSIHAIRNTLGVARASLHCAVNDLRLATQLERRREGTSRRGLSITLADAKILLSHLLAPRERVRKPRSEIGAPLPPASRRGYFYIVLLEPELDSGRFKAGYTRHLTMRLVTFRSCAPFSEYLYYWPCQRAWELTARDYITRYCEHLREEVYRSRDINSVLVRAAQFFVEMPDPRTKARSAASST